MVKSIYVNPLLGIHYCVYFFPGSLSKSMSSSDCRNGRCDQFTAKGMVFGAGRKVFATGKT